VYYVTYLFRFDTKKHLKCFLGHNTYTFPHFGLVFDNEVVFKVKEQAMKRRRFRTVQNPRETHIQLISHSQYIYSGEIKI